VGTKHTLESFHGRHTSALQGTNVGACWSAGGMWPPQHTVFTGELYHIAIIILFQHDK
jgi:hypothetical protein